MSLAIAISPSSGKHQSDRHIHVSVVAGPGSARRRRDRHHPRLFVPHLVVNSPGVQKPMERRASTRPETHAVVPSIAGENAAIPCSFYSCPLDPDPTAENRSSRARSEPSRATAQAQPSRSETEPNQAGSATWPAYFSVLFRIGFNWLFGRKPPRP